MLKRIQSFKDFQIDNQFQNKVLGGLNAPAETWSVCTSGTTSGNCTDMRQESNSDDGKTTIVATSHCCSGTGPYVMP